jgi:hypothetical protein
MQISTILYPQETEMKSKLFFAPIAAAILAPLTANAASAVIMSTDDARRAAHVMHASGQTAAIAGMLSGITPRTTDEARALAGLRIEFSAHPASEPQFVAIPSTTDQVRASFGRQGALSALVGSFDDVDAIG